MVGNHSVIDPDNHQTLPVFLPHFFLNPSPSASMITACITSFLLCCHSLLTDSFFYLFPLKFIRCSGTRVTYPKHKSHHIPSTAPLRGIKSMFLGMVYKGFYDLALVCLSCFISFHSWPHMFTLVVQNCLFFPSP